MLSTAGSGPKSYEGCLFINFLLETHDRQSTVRVAAVASI